MVKCFSSAVRIHLEIDGQVLSVAQVGNDFLILRYQSFFPDSSKATIVVIVDGLRREYPVIIRQTEGDFVFYENAG